MHICDLPKEDISSPVRFEGINLNAQKKSSSTGILGGIKRFFKILFSPISIAIHFFQGIGKTKPQKPTLDARTLDARTLNKKIILKFQKPYQVKINVSEDSKIISKIILFLKEANNTEIVDSDAKISKYINFKMLLKSLPKEIRQDYKNEIKGRAQADEFKIALDFFNKIQSSNKINLSMNKQLEVIDQLCLLLFDNSSKDELRKNGVLETFLSLVDSLPKNISKNCSIEDLDKTFKYLQDLKKEIQETESILIKIIYLFNKGNPEDNISNEFSNKYQKLLILLPENIQKGFALFINKQKSSKSILQEKDVLPFFEKLLDSYNSEKPKKISVNKLTNSYEQNTEIINSILALLEQQVVSSYNDMEENDQIEFERLLKGLSKYILDGYNKEIKENKELEKIKRFFQELL